MTQRVHLRRQFLKSVGALSAVGLPWHSWAQSTKPVVIGLAVTQSGPVGVADHADFWYGAKLAVKEVNAAGGVKGRPLELKVVDMDLLTPEGTQSAIRKLIDAKVNAIMSAFYVVKPAAAEAGAGYKAPFLHGSASIDMEEMLLKNPKRYGHMFQTAPAETYYGYGFAKYLEELEAGGVWKPTNKKVHLIREDLAYAKIITRVAEEQIKKRGKYQVAKISDVQFQVSDWGPTIQELHKVGAGVIMVNHAIASDLAAFAKQFAANPVPGALVYLQYAPSQPEFLTLAGPAAEGFIWGSLAGVLADKKGMAFRDKYRAEYLAKGGVMGMAYTGNGYDVVNMMAQIWSTTDADNFDAVSAQLRKTKYRGVNGMYNFTSPKQSVKAYPEETANLEDGMPQQFVQIQNGQNRIIGFNAVKEAVFRPLNLQNVRM